jgi:hypothetical protein
MLEEGGIYATRVSWGRWAFVRLLQLTESVVHLRFYNRKFWRRPSFARFDREDWTLGHCPVSRESVSQWNLIYLGNLAVDEEELTGYRIWAEDEGAGVFP